MIRVVESRRIRWKGYIDRVRDRRTVYEILIRKYKRKGQFRNISVWGGKNEKGCQTNDWSDLA